MVVWPVGALAFGHFFFQAEDGIRDLTVTGVQTCALPISPTCGCGAGSKVGGNAVRFVWPRQLLHALAVPPSPLNPTNTLCALVAATREGPEFKYPATPPTKTFDPLFAPPSGLMRYTFCAPKSATTNCVLSGVSAIPRSPAFGGGPFGGGASGLRKTCAFRSKTSTWSVAER